jgi:hypothetical protein
MVTTKFQFTDLDKNKFFKKVGYTPRPSQQKYHDSAARFRTPCCGRRFGKSLMVAEDLSFDCLPQSSEDDRYLWICGPTYKLGEKEYRIVYRNFINKLGIGRYIKKTYNVKQGDMRMEFPWGTILEVTSATNQDSLLGEGLDRVVMSEAARHSLETWQQYIEPAISDRRGKVDFPSTPQGFNWYHGMFRLGQQIDMPDYESWTFPSWDNIIRYPGGYDDPELVRVRSVASPGYWKQEYCAEFTSFEGQIYDEFSEKIHVKEIEYVPAWRNYRVFDYGYNDPLVCLDVMVDPSDNVYVWREYQARYKTTWEHAHILKEQEQPEGYHVDAMFGDPRGADEEATIALVLGQVYSEDVPWITSIEAVKRKLKIQPDGRPQLFIDRRCHELIRQMLALRFKETKEGKNAKEGQHDYDDHGPDALRYLIYYLFVLGAGSSLSDIYDSASLGSESETFFTSKRHITIDKPVGFY